MYYNQSVNEYKQKGGMIVSKIGKRLIIFVGTLILLFGSLLSPFLVLAEVYAQDSNMSVVNQPTTESTQDVSKTNRISPPTANQSSVTNESRSSTPLDSNANQSNVTTSTAASSTSNSTVTSQNENNNVTSNERLIVFT